MTTGRVPQLDTDGRFPDRFAPLSVAADKATATAAAASATASVATIATAATEVAGNATAASTSAGNASTSAGSAGTSAGASASSASAASTSAGASASSATASAGSATTAGSAATLAGEHLAAVQAAQATTAGQVTDVLADKTSAASIDLSATFAAKVGVNMRDFATLKAAIAALPADGGTVVIPIGPFAAGDWNYNTDYMNKPNVHLVGEAMPYLSDNADRLEGGSVIYGRFNVFAHGFSVSNVGFDMGKYVIDTFYGAVNTYAANHPLGGTWDAFAFAQPNMGTPISPRRGVVMDNVIGLLRDSGTVGHAMLTEGMSGGTLDGLVGVGGSHAVVVKSKNMKIGTLAGYAASANNVIVKADTYADAGHIRIGRVIAARNPPGVTPWFTPASTAIGLHINPQTASFTGPIDIGSVSAFGCADGIVFDGGAGMYASDIQIGDVLVDTYTGATTNGIIASGCRVQRVSIGDLAVNGAQQGVDWAPGSADDATQAQLHIGHAQFTSLTTRGLNLADYSRVKIDSLGIAGAPFAYNLTDLARALVGVERITATAKWERLAPTFTTGWDAFGGGNSPWDVYFENYGVKIRGLLKAATGATGTIASLPPYLRPLGAMRFLVYFNNGARSSALIGVDSGAGGIIINDGTAPAATDYVSVDGVGWQHV